MKLWWTFVVSIYGVNYFGILTDHEIVRETFTGHSRNFKSNFSI